MKLQVGNSNKTHYNITSENFVEKWFLRNPKAAFERLKIRFSKCTFSYKVCTTNMYLVHCNSVQKYSLLLICIWANITTQIGNFSNGFFILNTMTFRKIKFVIKSSLKRFSFVLVFKQVTCLKTEPVFKVDFFIKSCRSIVSVLFDILWNFKFRIFYSLVHHF